MQNWVNDKNKSVMAFEKIKDTILPKLIRGKLINIEASEEEVLALMDVYSGIDAIRCQEKNLQGIAWRAQWGKAWNTFTIRQQRHTGTKTELEKRIESIDNGYFYPAFTMQAYFDNFSDLNCLSVGIIKTVDLFNLYKTKSEIFKQRQSDNLFLYVEWDDLKPYIKTWEST
jgi:hypothetical protein